MQSTTGIYWPRSAALNIDRPQYAAHYLPRCALDRPQYAAAAQHYTFYRPQYAAHYWPRSAALNIYYYRPQYAAHYRPRSAAHPTVHMLKHFARRASTQTDTHTHSTAVRGQHLLHVQNVFYCNCQEPVHFPELSVLRPARVAEIWPVRLNTEGLQASTQSTSPSETSQQEKPTANKKKT